MGLELARMFVTVRADASMVAQDLQAAQSSAVQQVSQMTGQMDRNVDGFTDRLLNSLSGIQAGILATMGATARWTSQLLQGGTQAATSLEKTQVAFEVMLGSAEETQKTLNDLTQFAAKTPFEMPEILQAARGLIQFGDRGGDLMRSLNIIGNAAAGTSSQFGELALIFNQIRGVGKLLTPDFRQLSTRGVLSLQDIADYYGVASNAAQDMISKGKVSFNDLIKILEKLSGEGGRFNNMMEKQSQTMDGLTSTYNDAVNIMRRTISTPIVEWTKTLVRFKIKLVEQLTAVVSMFPDYISGALLGANAMSKLAFAIASARVAMRAFGITAKSVMIGTGVGAVFVALGAGIGMLLPYLMELNEYFWELKPVQDALADASKMLKEAWGHASIAASNLWTALSDLVIKLGEMMGFDFTALGGSLVEIFTSGVRAVSNFVLQTAKFVRVLTENWKVVAANLGIYLFGAFNLVYLEGVRVFTAFGDYLFRLWDAVKFGFQESFTNMWAFAKTGFVQFISTWRTLWTNIGNWMVQNFTKHMMFMLEGVLKILELFPEMQGMVADIRKMADDFLVKRQKATQDNLQAIQVWENKQRQIIGEQQSASLERLNASRATVEEQRAKSVGKAYAAIDASMATTRKSMDAAIGSIKGLMDAAVLPEEKEDNTKGKGGGGKTEETPEEKKKAMGPVGYAEYGKRLQEIMSGKDKDQKIIADESIKQSDLLREIRDRSTLSPRFRSADFVVEGPGTSLTPDGAMKESTKHTDLLKGIDSKMGTMVEVAKKGTPAILE